MNRVTLVIDLDQLDRISRDFGPNAREQLVWAAAWRIVDAIAADGTVGVINRGRFRVAMYKQMDEIDIDAISNQLHESLREPFAIADTEVFISASIGIALAPSHVADDTTAFEAERAARRVKANGGDATFIVRSAVTQFPLPTAAA